MDRFERQSLNLNLQNLQTNLHSNMDRFESEKLAYEVIQGKYLHSNMDRFERAKEMQSTDQIGKFTFQYG